MFLLGKFFLILAIISSFALTNFCADWRKVKSNTLAWLHSIYFVNENRGWITGSSGTLLATEDGGNSWMPSRKFTEDTIRDVYFSNEQEGWILTEKSVYSVGQLSPSSIWETTDGGKNWEPMKFEDEGKERLVRFFFSKEGTGRVVGEAGTLFEMSSGTKIWKKQRVPVRYLLLDGSFLDNTKGSIVGGGGSALFTDDGGLSWKPAVFTRKDNTKLNSIFFINQNIGWIAGAGGKIYSTNNGGKRWREQHSKITQDLSDIFFINTAEGWAVGDQGAILHTTTAGNIWENTSLSDVKHKLERVFSNGKKVWAVGFGGTIMVYDKEETENKKAAKSPVL